MGSSGGRLRSLVREPLLHFLAIGAALFLYFHWSGGGSGPTSSRIVLTTGQMEHLVAGFEKTWQHPPDAAELKGLIDDWVREEIAVREAMAIGLDRDDTVVRRRLRQKLEFLVEDVAATAAPAEQELQAWLDAHADAFRSEPRLALRQVYLSWGRHGAQTEADARAILARLVAAGPGARIDTLGDRTTLPQEIDIAPRSDVVSTFGEDFVAAIEGLPPGVWSGPVESSYGLHLVLVRERVEGTPASLATVRPAVERELLDDRRARQLTAMYEVVLGKYTIVVEKRVVAPAAVAAGQGGP